VGDEVAMGIDVGCRVRFLNEVGGGEVVKKMTQRRWLVRTEDGFELPMYESELVIDVPPEVVSRASKPEDANLIPKKSEAVQPVATKVHTAKTLAQRNLLSPRKGADSLYLGFAPYDAQDTARGPYTLYLINESPQEVLITLARFERTKCVTFFGGHLSANCCRKVCEIKANELYLYAFLRIQALYYVLGMHELQEPYVCDLEINGNEFTRPRSFRQNRFMEEDLLLVAVHDEVKEREIEALVERNLKGIEEVKAPEKEPPKGVPAPEQIEIDLHLEALIADRNINTNMTAGEKLQFQIQHFRRAMQEAIATPHIKRLVAIHGVGNGTLAKEVQRVLRIDFPQCRYQDASFKEYGYGATLVIIEHKK